MLYTLLGLSCAFLLANSGLWLHLFELSWSTAMEKMSIVELMRLLQETLAIRLASTLCFFACGLVWLLWFHKAYTNLSKHFAYTTKRSGAGALLNYFIPILNLFRPYQDMREVWEFHQSQSEEKKSPLLLNLWWGTWLIGNLLIALGYSLTSMAQQTNNTDFFTLSALLVVFASIVGLLSNVLAISTVFQITELQRSHSSTNIHSDPNRPNVNLPKH